MYAIRSYYDEMCTLPNAYAFLTILFIIHLIIAVVKIIKGRNVKLKNKWTIIDLLTILFLMSILYGNMESYLKLIWKITTEFN